MPRPKLPDTPTRAERTAAWRRDLIDRGGMRAPVTLQPEDAARARALMAERGVGFGELVALLLRDAQ